MHPLQRDGRIDDDPHLSSRSCRISSSEGVKTAGRFSCLAMLGGALPEIGAGRGRSASSRIEAVFGLGAAAVLGGAALQRFDDILRDVSNQQLRALRVSSAIIR